MGRSGWSRATRQFSDNRPWECLEFCEVNKSMTKMYLQNLSPSTTVESLNRLFSGFGAVRSISLATDVMTGRCGGFGFVHLYEQETGAALCALDGKTVNGRIIRVTIEKKDLVSPDSRR